MLYSTMGSNGWYDLNCCLDATNSRKGHFLFSHSEGDQLVIFSVDYPKELFRSHWFWNICLSVDTQKDYLGRLPDEEREVSIID